MGKNQEKVKPALLRWLVLTIYAIILVFSILFIVDKDIMTAIVTTISLIFFWIEGRISKYKFTARRIIGSILFGLGVSISLTTILKSSNIDKIIASILILLVFVGVGLFLFLKNRKLKKKV